MKAILLISILSAIIALNCLGQNNFEDLDAAQVTAITIKSHFEPDKPVETKLIDKAGIERIVLFLKHIELKEWNADQASPDPDDFIFQISLNDRKDQIYLFEKAAFIAKTKYCIDKEVVNEFNYLYKAIISQ